MTTKKRGPLEKGCWGCLAVVILLILVGMLGRYWISASFRAREKTYAATNSQFPFEPNPDTRLSQDQLETYAAVRQMVLPSIEEYAREIDAMREEKQRTGGGFWLGIRTTISMMKRTTAVQDAHIAALNEHNMSVEEYRWVGQRAFTALYQGAQAGNPECREAWDLVNQGFIQGAPRIAKYRENPPDLVERLELDGTRVALEEIELVVQLLSQLFKPEDTLYQGIGLVLQGEKEVE